MLSSPQSITESTNIAADPCELAWAAGIVDGEGCIYIRRNISPVGTENYALAVKVVMTHEATVRRIHRIFNLGSVGLTHRASPNHKQAWTWKAMSRQAERVLTSILPWLYTKQDQADIALEFMRVPVATGGRKTPASIQDERVRLYWTLREAK